MNEIKSVSSKKYHPVFLFFSFAAYGDGISGSDRIFIELARRWGKKNEINLYVFDDGYAMCKREQLQESNIKFHVFSLGIFTRLGFVTNYIAKIIYSLYIAFTMRLPQDNNIICYSSSEFWMDSLPVYILKLRFPFTIWVASWYQTAPNPLKGFTEGKREKKYRFRALLYYLVQLPVKFIIDKNADFVVVNNTDEQKRFPKQSKQEKTIVLIGAVDVEKILLYKNKLSTVPKKYAAVFQGRFHPQKGVVELVEIWAQVVKEIPDAVLVMIGDGPLMQEVKTRIETYHLQKNIVLSGYLFDGEEKYRLFAQSRIVVHPSFFDSGGMAAAEAMAFGLPCVGFDLQSYISYYPKGMRKVEFGNKSKFAEAIIELLQNKAEASRLGAAAEEMIIENYSWDKRAKEVYEKIV